MQLPLAGGARCRSGCSKMLAARCAKGFGVPAERPQDKPANQKPNMKGRYKGDAVDGGSSKAVQRAVDLVERRSPPINANEASRGRVNYVRVKDWGSGKAEDVGELQVQSASQAFNVDAHFYEQLARRLEALQAEGALTMARPAGAAPLPPFEHWAFAEAHYVQHLGDLLCIHAALEQAVSLVRVLLQSSSGQTSTRLASAVGLFGAEHGLDRSQQIAADLASLTGSPGMPSTCASAPLPNAAAYAKYVRLIAEQCERAENATELASAVARLLANVYVVQLTLLTAGTRIGAAATEKRDLFSKNAVHTYRTYPEYVDRPLEAFMTSVNGAGEVLLEAEREAWFAELPGAMQKASLLLEALAKR